MTRDDIHPGALHPLRTSAVRLSELDDRLRFVVIASPAELPDGSWVSLDQAAATERVDEWLTGTANGMRGVAGARVGLSFACAVVRPLMAVLHLTGRCPVLRPSDVYLRTDAGLFTELAIRADAVYCLPGDPDAGHPAMRPVAGFDELIEHAAGNVYALLAPVLTTVRAQGRRALRHLWGGVLDMIGATSLLAARIGALPQHQTWQRAAQLCDLVHRLSEQPTMSYPTPFSVTHATGDALFTVKGTCCLQYREHGLRAGEPDEQGNAYCKTCPFLGEQIRLQRCASTAERDVRSGAGHNPGDYLPYN